MGPEAEDYGDEGRESGYRNYYCTGNVRDHTPPEGFTTITISDELAGKLARITSRHECESYAEAVEYAANGILANEDELSNEELIEMVADRRA